ncbi:MAG TPA: cisplatin damage response ATP-dependent DNA ligase [Acetobacteraceae bacterium]|nr:cisplatin damage response ATP-dependent DNA ligase [Acetobacteraceae bacterium]
MIAFASLIERLTLTPGRLAKLALMQNFFATEVDPDRGWALAALTGELSFDAAKPAMIRALAEERTDATLFRWSYDFVGDLAETVSLIWSAETVSDTPPSLAEVVAMLREVPKSEVPALLAGWLDSSGADVRYALLKLITGALRAGVSARLAKTALAGFAAGNGLAIAPDDIEEVWHGLTPPYTPLFDWLTGRGPRPDPADAPVFRPPMLAHPLEAADLASLRPEDYAAEWKWDGIRVQLVAGPGGRRIFSRGADDISGSFPDIMEKLDFHAVLDGELLVARDGIVAPFAELQQRLNRKAPSAKMQADYPASVRLYDILFDGTEDLRALDFAARRARLEAWFAQNRPARMDLSPLVPFDAISELVSLRANAREAGIEGLMLKRLDSTYVPGRPRGKWWKWKRDPLTLDCVLMYAQRGHGKRSSFYSDYTFGVWRDDDDLVPVGKAYSGYTDEELLRLDSWIRNHTVARFGPVREVERGLVLEVAFDAAQRSTRHKSGVALRFPRIARLRWDKPAAEADRLETVMRLVQ